MLYDIMIVDDSAEIRTGLMLKLHWPEYGFRVVMEASNGREALGKLQTRPVPLVVTDIRMPVMDGLGLLQQCAIHYPGTRTIVLSAYSDFPLIQTAIRQGAKDYLLKPVLKDELIATLGKIRKELDEERGKALFRIVREQLSETAAHDMLSIYGLSDWRSPHAQFRFVTAEMRVPPARLSEHADMGASFNHAFHLLMSETVSEWGGDIVMLRDPQHADRVHFVLRHISEHVDESRLHRFLADIREKVLTYLRLELVVGVGHPVDGWQGWKEGIASSQLSLSRSKLDVVSQTIFDDDMETDTSIPNAVIRELIFAVENDHEAQLIRSMELIEQIGKKSSVQSFTVFLFQLCLALDDLIRKHELKDPNLQMMLWPYMNTEWNFDAASRTVDSIRRISSQIMQSLQGAKQRGNAHTIKAICQYIQDYYAEELTLASIASQFHYNAAYLSDLFRRTTGTTFSEYLLNIRMEHACRLLRDSQLKIADVAQLTGFSSPAYFSNVFKNYMGTGPNEFRKHATDCAAGETIQK